MKSFLRKSTIHNNLYSSLLQKDGEAQVLADNDVEAPAGWLVVKEKTKKNFFAHNNIRLP